jgi:hypothetical protein
VAPAAAGPSSSAAGTRKRRRGRLTIVNIKLVTWSLSLFGAVTFLVCVAYGLIAPEALHMGRALEAVLPGFRWLTLVGFVVGLLESFLYGVYAGLVFGWIHHTLYKRWGTSKAA